MHVGHDGGYYLVGARFFEIIVAALALNSTHSAKDNTDLQEFGRRQKRPGPAVIKQPKVNPND
jgi:hypothetical protein